MSTIELQNLTKAFGDLIAVNDVSLKVEENEVLCLLGPSGCGKTTTLRMVAGLEVATSGDILIANKNVNDLDTRDRNLAMAFQFYALYPSLTVAENLAELPGLEHGQKVVVGFDNPIKSTGHIQVLKVCNTLGL